MNTNIFLNPWLHIPHDRNRSTNLSSVNCLSFQIKMVKNMLLTMQHMELVVKFYKASWSINCLAYSIRERTNLWFVCCPRQALCNRNPQPLLLHHYFLNLLCEFLFLLSSPLLQWEPITKLTMRFITKQSEHSMFSSHDEKRKKESYAPLSWA